MRLPLLEYADKLFSINLSDCVMIACQHMLGSQYLMFEKFFSNGLKPENTFILGKCYSSNKIIINKLKSRGAFLHEGSLRFDSYKSFDEQFENDVKDLILKAKKNITKSTKVILLDDGGYLIILASKMLKNNKIVAVEQTSSGFHKLQNIKPKFPIINVARSKAKLNLETPTIIKAITRTLYADLKKIKLKPKTVLIIGMGAIGTHLYKNIKNKFKVYTYDKTDIDNSLLNKLHHFDMIIGCTGHILFNEYSKLKKDVILVSTSSSDREFDAVNIRKKEKRNNKIHKIYHVDNMYLLNSGFPVCFTGTVHSSPPREIQLTIALLYSAVMLGLKNNYPKELIALDKTIQQMLITKYCEIINLPKPI